MKAAREAQYLPDYQCYILLLVESRDDDKLIQGIREEEGGGVIGLATVASY